MSIDTAGLRVTPFICGDREWELEAELRFGPNCPPDRRREVAQAFWGLLAADPAALANYRDRFKAADGHDVGPAVAGYWQGLFHFWCSRW